MDIKGGTQMTQKALRAAQMTQRKERVGRPSQGPRDGDGGLINEIQRTQQRTEGPHLRHPFLSASSAFLPFLPDLASINVLGHHLESIFGFHPIHRPGIRS